MRRLLVGSYVLGVIVLTDVAFADGDDTPQGAWQLDPGESAGDHLYTTSDRDWWKVTGISGSGSLTWYVHSMVGGPGMLITIYHNPYQTSGSPSTLRTIAAGSGQLVRISVDSSGEYFMKAAADGPIGSGLYMVNVAFRPDVPPQRYTLTLLSDPSNGGNIVAAPLPEVDGKYAEGAVVTLTAIPHSPYRFAYWHNNTSGSSNPKQITMDRDKTVYAKFTQDQFLGNQGSSSGVSDDPVNLATGNFFLEEADLSIVARGIPVEFVRHYNSQDVRQGPLGPGWSHTYHIVLTEHTDTNEISVRWPDGRTDFWNMPPIGSYAFSDLGYGSGRDINNSAQIILSGLLWEDGATTDTGGTAVAVSDSGLVVGVMDEPHSRYCQAYIWSKGGGPQPLSDGWWYSSPNDVNDASQVVGHYWPYYEMYDYAFSWTESSGPNLLFNGSDEIGSDARAINEQGDVVGWTSIFGPPYQRAFLWKEGTGGIDLGAVLGGLSSEATGVNDPIDNRRLGCVVGWSETGGGGRHAFWWSDRNGNGQSEPHEEMIDLGTLGADALNSEAYGINDYNEVVGKSEAAGGEGHAFLWVDKNGNGLSEPNEEMIDLNTQVSLESGWVLVEANAINNAGQIVGGATFNGEDHAFLLTPQSGVLPSIPGRYDRLRKNVDGSWTVTGKNLDTYNFDTSGRLVRFADKNGNAITLSYNNPSVPDFVTGVTDPAGRALLLNYNASGVLETVTDFAVPPRLVQYSYSNGRLTQTTDTLGNRIQYGHNAQSGYLKTVVDQRSVTTVTNTYDDQGRVTQQADGNNNITTFAYEAPVAGQTTITRTVTVPGEAVPRTLQTIHTHSEPHKLLTSIKNPLNGTTSYGYDEQLQRDSITDRNGGTTSFVYDVRGNVTQTTEANDPSDANDGGVTLVEYANPRCPDVPTRKTDALGYITEWTYDGRCNVIAEVRWLDHGQTKSVSRGWTYNPFGQRQIQTDERGNVHEWGYDADGKLIEERDWDYSDPANPVIVSNIWYGGDELWRRIWETDGRGSGPEDPPYTTYYAYDRADQLVRITSPPVGDAPHTIAQHFGYDMIGNRTWLTDGRGAAPQDPDHTAYFFYDNNSNLRRIEEPLGRVTEYGYDKLNRCITLTDANLHTTTFYFDGADRLERMVDAEGNQWTYTYDGHGNMLTETDPTGVTLTYEYDVLHRRTLIRDELNYERHTEYDPLGRVVRQVDANGNDTNFSHDALGSLTCVVDAEGGWTEYRYDETGNLIEIENAKDDVVSIRRYDALNRLIYAVDGIGNYYEYGYDAAGNLIRVKDAKSQESFLRYDAENRLTQIAYPDATQATYVYDDSGNRTGMTDPTGTSSFTYDKLNRLRTSMDGFGPLVQYGYDAVGNRTSLTYPDAKQVTYGYDQANRLTTIMDWGSRVTRYTYNGLRRETVTYPNGVVETRSYDNAGRLESMNTANSMASPLLGFTWVRDGEGNPRDVTETGTLQPTLEQLVVEYEYDADNRLTASTQGTYQHDANGNLTSRTVGGVTTALTYDAEDRLTSQTTGASIVGHVYDGVGHRVARIDNGADKRYVLDRGRSMSHVLCETNHAGVITAYYVQGPQLVGRIGADGTERYYHTNDIGSVVALTDGNGQVTDRYGYTPFGLLRNQEGTTPNPFTYVGGLGVMAEADGLYFMRARFYDPDAGRFLGKDPVEGMLTDPQGLHRYVYALNNSIVYHDASGQVLGMWDFIQGMIEEFIVQVVPGAQDAVEAVGVSISAFKTARRVITGHAYADVLFKALAGKGLKQLGREYMRTVIRIGEAIPDIGGKWADASTSAGGKLWDVSYAAGGALWDLSYAAGQKWWDVSYAAGGKLWDVSYAAGQKLARPFKGTRHTREWQYNLPYLRESDTRWYWIELK